ncbi:MAG: hypothetical protein V7L27_10910 [Nostoc sp.]|uniref:hypothetical protein n=1 Tax=Nostoc sp. TaxID=1180 RepID=UPI002FFA1179
MPKFLFLLAGFVVKALTLKIEMKKAFTKKAKVKSKKAKERKKERKKNKNGQKPLNLFMGIIFYFLLLIPYRLNQVEYLPLISM